MELAPAALAGLWGFLGAFIYAAPRWLACIVSHPGNGQRHRVCTLELFVALTVGAAAAAAFAKLALTTLHIQDENSVAAVIGLVANHPKAAPVIVKRFLGAFGVTDPALPRASNEDGSK